MAKDNVRRAVRGMRVHQWSPGLKTTWKPAAMLSALTLHQHGDFSASAKLVDAMWQDDELPTSLESATNYITGAAFKMEPVMGENGEPDPESLKMAELFEDKWSEHYPAHLIGNLLNWFTMLGAAPGTIDWEKDDEDFLNPSARVLHCEFLRWDSEELDPQKNYGVFKYETRDGEINVTPGDGKWILLSDGRESWMRCGVRALATTWLIKQQALRDWARYNERHGMPIVKVMVPQMADSEDKEELFADISGMGTETTALLPQGFGEDGEQGFDIDLLEAKDQAFDSFSTTIERCDRKFQVHFLGTNTNELIGTAGSRATSESGRSISMNKALERWRRVRADIRDQLLKPWIALNFPGFDLSLTPWPNYLVEGDEDLKLRAETNKLYFESLNAAKTAGFEVKNIEEDAAQYGLELEERPPEPMPEMVPGQGPPGVQNKPPSNSNGQKEELSAAELAEGDELPSVDEVGRRAGMVAGQLYTDALADSLAKEAKAIEELDAVAMSEIISEATGPKDLERRLAEYLSNDDPVILGRVYEKAILLSQLAGLYGAQGDL